MAEGASFLPRIESVFYAVFDVRQGPKIAHQVPEGLIAISSSSAATSTPPTSALLSPTTATPIVNKSNNDPSLSRNPSSAVVSPALQRVDSPSCSTSPQKRSESSSRFLFNFDDISKYIIPSSALCGRKVIYATRNHRVLGFPVELRGRYERNYFRYNLCFVFERTADLSCYEPVVRKVSRVLRSCEEESAFLSSPQNSSAIYAILEQLYEDLNSYSETSIQIDKFNSIELKIFPFYPNPPPVKDWMVPLALINITRRIESNWDLTIVKVCPYIDGTNHVSRIAQLAECDINLTREAISHLLYYQVMMMIDIFQFSNMYTLRKSIQWLADADDVKEECGPYVTKPGAGISDWPKLLHLYSRLKPGKTVLEWMKEYDVLSHGIDVRRFLSFGVVKGFLRRVHRWPILLKHDITAPPEVAQLPPNPPRKRGDTFSSLSLRPSGSTVFRPESDQVRARSTVQEAQPTITSAGAELVAVKTDSRFQPLRRTSAAETSLEQLRSREVQKTGDRSLTSRQSQRLRAGSTTAIREHHRRPQFDPSVYSSTNAPLPTLLSSSPQFSAVKMSPDAFGGIDLVDSEHSSGGRSTLGWTRPKLSRSPSGPVVHLPHTASPFPPDLLPLLDGEHHTDELCTRFNVGWPLLEQWLVIAGGGQDSGDMGNVCIIYR